MGRDEALQRLSEHFSEIAGFGVERVAVFGSVARDEATSRSDIDLLVEFRPDERVGMFRFLELKEYLEGVFGCEVDLVTREGLKPRLRQGILSEAVEAVSA